MGILEGNPVPFIEDDRVLIDEFYLVQGHILKKGPNDSLVFFSLGHSNEIPLPNAEYHLYNCRSLTITLAPQEESRKHSVSRLRCGCTEVYAVAYSALIDETMQRLCCEFSAPGCLRLLDCLSFWAQLSIGFTERRTGAR